MIFPIGAEQGEWNKEECKWYWLARIAALLRITEGRLIDRYTREKAEERDSDKQNVVLHR